MSCFLSYPYYSIRLLNKNNRVITWIRYTIWIILYPLGAFLEGKINLFVLFKCLVFLNFFFLFSGLIIYKSIDYYHSKRYFTLDLPNRINFAFNFATFLQIYLGLLPFGKKNLYSEQQNFEVLSFRSSSNDATHVESKKKDFD